MPSPNQYLLGGSDPSPILAPVAPSQPTPWYLDPQQRGAVTSVLSALAAPLTDAYQHAANLAQGRGDYGMELASGLLAAAGLAAPPAARGATTAAEELAPAVENAVARGIKAYHGSPYDFERFDASKIGTGEGAQAYGHGMYFAENPDVADLYSRVVAANKQGWTGKPKALDAPKAQGLPDELAGRLQASWQNSGPDVARNLAKRMFEDNRGATYSDALHYLAHDADWSPLGKRYEVNINSDPEHFLDWDKPLSEQSEHVQGALEKIRAHALQDEGTRGSTLADVLKGDPLTGQIIGAHNLAYGGGKAEETLRQAGIPGIKYLDQGSRASGEGTHNYVVFDPATIDIIRKYGIAALMGGGAAAAGAGVAPQPAQAGQNSLADTIRALQSQ